MNNKKKSHFYISLLLVIALLTGLNYTIIKMAAYIPNITIPKLSLLLALIYVIPSAIHSYKKLS